MNRLPKIKPQPIQKPRFSPTKPREPTIADFVSGEEEMSRRINRSKPVVIGGIRYYFPPTKHKEPPLRPMRKKLISQHHTKQKAIEASNRYPRPSYVRRDTSPSPYNWVVLKRKKRRKK